MTNHWRDIRHADVIIINGANPAEAHPVGLPVVPEGEARSQARHRQRRRRQDDPRRPAVHADLGGGRRLRAHPDRHRRRLLRRPDQLRAREQPDPPRLRPELHQRLVPGEGGVRLQRGPVQRLRPGQAHVRHLDVGLRGRRAGAGRVRADPEGDRGGRPGPGRRRRGRGARQARHAARAPALGVPAPAQALLPLHAGDGRARSPASPRTSSCEIAKIVGEMRPARQGDDGRLRGRAHAPHHRRPAHPHRRPAAAAARQHGPAGRRHERRARPRQHPGQHRQRDLVGDPARLPAHPGAGAEEPRRLRDPERAQEVRRRTPGTSSAPTTASSWSACSRPGTATRRRQDNEFAFDFIPKPATNSSWISIYDQALKKKMEGVILSGHDRDQHRSRRQPGDAGAGQPQVAGGDGPAADDQLGVLAAAGRGPEVDPDRGLHDPDHALDREGRLVREQRPLDAVEGGRRSRPRATPPRPLDPGRGVRSA